MQEPEKRGLIGSRQRRSSTRQSIATVRIGKSPFISKRHNLRAATDLARGRFAMTG
jgi:hypothetical protein